MDGRWFTPDNAVKPTLTSLPALVTLPPLPQAATTCASTYIQELKNNNYKTPNQTQSPWRQTF